jgi:hypothetical protein
MKTLNRAPMIAGAIVALGTLLTTHLDASSGDFHPSYMDAKVIAHLALSGTPARHMFLQEASQRQYLYVQQSFQEGFTVVDVTKPNKPKIVGRIPQENLMLVASGLAIAERRGDSVAGGVRQTATAEGYHGGGSVSESLQVLDLSDPVHPRAAQTFDGVTSILADEADGLTYVANGEGIWIVSHQQVLTTHRCSSSDAISGDPNCD